MRRYVWEEWSLMAGNSRQKQLAKARSKVAPKNKVQNKGRAPKQPKKGNS